MKVSIIIRAFNEEKFIKLLFDGIFSQKTTYQYEVILVDSGSTDRTLDIASNYNVKIVHINPADFTFGYSLNKGIEESSGDICVMISAHCYPSNDYWLERLVSAFSDEKLAIAYGRQMGTELTAYSEHRLFNRWFPDRDIVDSELAFCNNANSAIRKAIWYDYKFDENLTGLEDLDWARHVKKLGYSISYVSQAKVFHIHEQSIKQIYNRYYREAFAYKEIYPREHFGFVDFVKFFIMNWGGDYLHALKDRVLVKNLISIPIFRFCQFFGTYKAHQYKTSIHLKMKKKLYYPDKPDFSFNHKEVVTSKNPSSSDRKTYVDISMRVDDSLAVWPGSTRFQRLMSKSFDEDGFEDSTFTMNVHCGTHLDAPSHFIEGGKPIDEIPVERFFGRAQVIEWKESRPISKDFIKKIKIKDGVNRILFKTLNSTSRKSEFNKDFIALTSDAAKELAEMKVSLVGVDGPSVQLFHDENNDTHLHLLGKNILVLENLDMSEIEEGVYDLTVLPLKIKGLEGSPARAILTL